MRVTLLNFTHSETEAGGVETRYRLLEKALVSVGHNVQRLATTLVAAEDIITTTDASDLVISDSAICIASNCPMITVFGNPWYSVLDLTPEDGRISYIAQREKRWHSQYKTTKVAVSEFMASEMTSAGITADKVIPNPADIDRFSTNQTSVNRPIILWCGSEAEIKQYERAKKASEIWNRYSPKVPVRWTFALKGVNRLSYHDMTIAYEKASVVLCTSYAEGCSNSLMESIGSNTPIVATKVGIFWDWWDERLGELIQNPKDTEEYIQALRTILASPEKYSPQQAAIDAGLDYNSWADKWQKLVTEVA